MDVFQDYIVGGSRFRVMDRTLCEAVASMPGFSTFRVREVSEPDFRYCLSEDLPSRQKRLYEFEADGVSSVFRLAGEAYLLEMSRADGVHMDLWCRKGHPAVFIRGDLEPQLLRFAMWLGYGIVNAHAGRIAVHSSCIVKEGRAVLFLGESGTGKSTHTRLWREHVPGSSLLNDDSPILVAEADGVYVYGSPWSGKTPCYRQERFPLAACVRLSQAPHNAMKRLSHLAAYAAIHPSCPPEFAYDEELYDGISATVGRLISEVPFYRLECLPDADAARLSSTTIFD